MSTLTVEILQNVIHLYIIYSLSIISAIGIIGNLCNIIMFISLKKIREHPSAYYIITESIIDLILLFIGSALRVVDEIYHFSSNPMLIIWCKLRQPIFLWCTLTIICLINFAVIDQFLSTNHRPHLRQLSTIKLAKYLICILVITVFLYDIPFIVFFEIKTMFGCIFRNAVFTRYYSYFHLFILTGILPVLISLIFSISAYRNVRRIHRQQMNHTRRRIDQQLTAMILARVILYLCCSFPYIAQGFYTMNSYHNTEGSLEEAIGQLTTAVNSSLSYASVAVRR